MPAPELQLSYKEWRRGKESFLSDILTDLHCCQCTLYPSGTHARITNVYCRVRAQVVFMRRFLLDLFSVKYPKAPRAVS